MNATRAFVALCALLSIGLAAVAAHLSGYDHTGRTAQIQNLAALTRMPGVTLSVHANEEHFRACENAALNAYVEMPPLDTMDYLYAR